MEWPEWVVAAFVATWAVAASAADPVEVLPPVALTVEAPAATDAEKAEKKEPKSPDPVPAGDPPRHQAHPTSKPVVELRGRIEADALCVSQSAANRQAVGDLQNATGFRRARLGAQGAFGEHLRWVAEFDFADGIVRFADVFAGLGGLPVPGELRIGHFREPFSLEGQISSNHFPFLERSPANALDPARNWGVALFTHTPDETATLAAGVFRAASDRVARQQTDEAGLACTARATWLAYHDGADDPESLIHVGAAASHRSPPTEAVVFQVDPESDLLVAGDSPQSPFVQGVMIAARSVWLYNLELATAAGPAWAMAEWRAAVLDQTHGGEVVAWGGYVSGGYFLTGEHRQYDRPRGTFGRVRVADPVYRSDDRACGIGAWEVVGRVAYLDQTDPDLPRAEGGQRTGADALTFTTGVNWYLTDFARLMLDYTHFRIRPSGGRWSGGSLVGARFALFW